MAEPATQQLDLDRLGSYLEQAIPGFQGLEGAKKFGGGQSNPTFLLTAASGRYVLRRKPPGQLLKSAHAVEREHRVMAALGGTPVPVPRMYLLCEDEAVIGSTFFVMEFLDGVTYWDPALPEVAQDLRRPIYEAMVDALAALHQVDHEAVGLGDYGRSGSYFARQTGRWSKQYEASVTQEIPAMDKLIAWVQAEQPDDDGLVGLVHGDYRIDNMIFANGEARILGILDWELSTLGHPYSDLAYLCMQWRMPNEGVFRGLGGIDRAAHSLPTEEEVVARYCAAVGIESMPQWRYYLAFNFFRMAAILQGIMKRVIEGTASDPERGREMGKQVPLLAEMGLAVAEGRSE